MFILLFIAGGFFAAGMVLLLSGAGLVVGSQATQRFAGATPERKSRGRKRNICFAMFFLFVGMFTLMQEVSLPALVLLAICLVIFVVTGYRTPSVRRKVKEMSHR